MFEVPRRAHPYDLPPFEADLYDFPHDEGKTVALTFIGLNEEGTGAHFKHHAPCSGKPDGVRSELDLDGVQARFALHQKHNWCTGALEEALEALTHVDESEQLAA